MIFKVLRFQRVALYTLPHLILQNFFMPGFKGKAVGKISRTSLYNTITRLSVLHEGWGGGLWVAAGTLAKINERPEIIKAALNYANLPKFFGCANFSTMEFFSRATYKTSPPPLFIYNSRDYSRFSFHQNASLYLLFASAFRNDGTFCKSWIAFQLEPFFVLVSWNYEHHCTLSASIFCHFSSFISYLRSFWGLCQMSLRNVKTTFLLEHAANIKCFPGVSISGWDLAERESRNDDLM